MHSRNGKIARLPKAIREELNQRLDNGETGRSLVAWLNSLPEVKAVMETLFAGAEIREQNLSEWKKGGYLEWVRHQEAMALAERLYERAEEMKAKDEEQMPMSEVLSLWLGARYAVATEEIAATGGPEGWKQLRQMCGDVARLRRLDQQAQKLELEGERVELLHEKVTIEQERWALEKKKASPRPAKSKGSAKAETSFDLTRPSVDWSDEQKIAWVLKPESWEQMRPLSNAERQRKIAEIYGRA